MCGITGYLSLNQRPASQKILQAMADTIEHRGPDGEGYFVDGALGLAHRRLAIIDLSPAGHQPMQSQDGRYVLAHNGEIYNYQTIRMELEALGYQFRSQTDTEVVLNAFCEWQEAAVEKFNGMFAFVIWDKKERRLFMARDRYGIKPLYYCFSQGQFIFGSEVKAILPHPNYPLEVDTSGLLEYFTFQNFFSEKTLYQNIHLFPAGHYAYVSESTAQDKLELEQYWDFDFTEPEQIADEREYLEELDRLFTQAVNRQLVSDVEVGSYLSGGMDSGSITAIAAQQIPGMKTFTVGFDLSSASGLELNFDERQASEAMSYQFKTEHYEMVLKAGDMERAMDKLVWHLDEPRVGQSYPNFYAAQLASKFCKVVLSGAGGDELFGGYPWRYYRALVNNDFEDYIDKYYHYWQRLIDNKDLWQLFAPIKSDVEHVWTRDIFKTVFQDRDIKLTRPEDYINHSLYFEAKTFLHSLLVIEDKLSMAHSLETRVPFLDNDLVDFAMRVPVSMKIQNLKEVVKIDENEPGSKTRKYFEKTKDGKRLLRHAMAKYISKDVTERMKQGFSAPDNSWFKGESLAYVQATLVDNNNAKLFQYFDQSMVKRLIEEHLSGQVNRRLLIWSLLNFETWCQQNL